MRGTIVVRTLWVSCDFPCCERRALRPVQADGTLSDPEISDYQENVLSMADLIAEGRRAGWHIPQRVTDPHYCPKHARAKAAETT